MKIIAAILAGGSGSRAGTDVPKQFYMIEGFPLIFYTLSRFENHPSIDDILCVCHKNYIDEISSIVKRNGISKCIGIIQGGNTRQESSYNAVNCGLIHTDDIILIHDAARPFVARETIQNVIDGTKLKGAAYPCSPVTDTIIETDENEIIRIPDRKKLLSAQTPQGFIYQHIHKAHESAQITGYCDATDDIGLILNIGIQPEIVPGDSENFKITTARDIFIAEALLGKGKQSDKD